MKQKTVWMVPMAAILALSLVGCGEKPAQNTDDALQNAGEGDGKVTERVEESAGSRDLAGAEGLVGYQKTVQNPIPNPRKVSDSKGSGVSGPMERIGDGVKNTLDDMGEKAEDLARDVKTALE